MPEPQAGESKDEYINRCIPYLVKEGNPQDQAVAICHSMWKQKNENRKIDMTNRLIEKYLGEAKGGMSTSQMRKEYEGYNLDSEIVALWNNPMKISGAERDLYMYMMSKISLHAPSDLGDYIKKELNNRLRGKITDYMAANIGVELASSGSQSKRNKKQKEQSDIVLKETWKIMKEWLKKFKEIHEKYGLNTAKLNQHELAAPTKAKPAFEEFMASALGTPIKTKDSYWKPARRPGAKRKKRKK